jgi:hypothetical protein
MKHKIKLFFTSISILVLLFTASACKQKRKRIVPDVSSISIALEIKRFEQDFMRVDTNDIVQSLQKLKHQYPGFYDCFMGNILGVNVNEANGEFNRHTIGNMLKFQGIKADFDSTSLVYPDLSGLKKDLKKTFQYHTYYFPDVEIPQIITFISHYQYGIVICNDSTIGVGLDLFLGRDFTFYPLLNFPEYMIKMMSPESIVPNVMKTNWTNMWGNEPAGNTLLDYMIENGKQLYYLDMVLPEWPDSLKIGFDAKEIEWCMENEGEIWAYFLDNDRIYDNNRGKFNYLISPGATTQGMPMESPGNVGSWLGWQIVRQYMEENPKITLKQLAEEKDGQRILGKARYKPRNH